jgi:DNA repair exonuclease SbcCD ATPase subunit
MDEVTNSMGRSERPKWHSPVILLTAAVLIAGNIYFLVKTSDLKQRLSRLESVTQSGLSTMRETLGSESSEAAKKLDQLSAGLDEERGRASQDLRQATQRAQRHADDLAQKIEAEAQQAQRQVFVDLGEVKDVATSAHTKIAETNDRVSTVDSRVTQTRSDLEKTVADLKSAEGDMGVQSGLIATNAKELAALRELGERNYLEFDVKKTNQPQRVGTVSIVLRKADPKRNRYTLDVLADDKRVEKRDRSINEPVQFYISRAHQPYEIVVNEVQKDRVVGYLAVPKVLSASR